MNAAEDLAMVARVVASLIAVVALAGLAARMARRSTRRSAGAGPVVVSRLALSREASLAIAEVDGRRLVLGVTSHAVSLLADLATPAPAGATRSTPQDGSADEAAPAFPPDPAERGLRVVGLPRREISPGLDLTTSGDLAGALRALAPGSSSDLSGVRAASRHRRARPVPAASGSVPGASGSVPAAFGSVLAPSTWRQGVQALRDLTVRRA
jgi:flagellar protein FliO/FliZ